VLLGFAGAAGSSLVTPCFNLFGENHVAADVPGSAVLIGAVSEHPEDNLLGGFQRSDLEN
jgi:hypothetical protein